MERHQMLLAFRENVSNETSAAWTFMALINWEANLGLVCLNILIFCLLDYSNISQQIHRRKPDWLELYGLDIKEVCWKLELCLGRNLLTILIWICSISRSEILVQMKYMSPICETTKHDQNWQALSWKIWDLVEYELSKKSPNLGEEAHTPNFRTVSGASHLS